MALNKIQSIINNLSKDPKVKKVISDVQAATKDIQSKLKHVNKAEALKAYKKIVKQVVSKENDLQKTIITKAKKSVVDLEKNLKNYKKQAEAKRTQLEKMLKSKAGAVKTAAPKKRSAPKRKTAKK